MALISEDLYNQLLSEISTALTNRGYAVTPSVRVDEGKLINTRNVDMTLLSAQSNFRYQTQPLPISDVPIKGSYILEEFYSRLEQFKTDINDLIGCNSCTKNCTVVCGWGCTNNCGGNNSGNCWCGGWCESRCTGSFFVNSCLGCDGGCSDSCRGGCSSCDGSCDGNCDSGACTDTCKTTCKNSCTSNCSNSSRYGVLL